MIFFIKDMLVQSLKVLYAQVTYKCMHLSCVKKKLRDDEICSLHYQNKA